MITILKKGSVRPDYKVECPHCHSIFTFNNSDTSYTNINYSNEQYITCPICGDELVEKQWESWR